MLSPAEQQVNRQRESRCAGAARHWFAVYDAAYFELAQRRRLPLGCKDGPLRRAARRAGLAIWEYTRPSCAQLMRAAQRALPEGPGQWTHDGYSLNSLAGRRLRSSEEPFSRSGDPSNTSYLLPGVFLLHAARGPKADALACLADEWTRAVWEDYFGPLTMAEGFALIGERAESIRWLGVPASLGSAPLAVTSVP